MTSRSRILICTALTAAVIGLWPVSIVRAQQPLATIADINSDVAQTLEQGSRLEQQKRWAEALSHYEEALRAHPERPELKQRLTMVRAHYDVARRYADVTYTKAIHTITEREALAIYEEVLLKVSAHYVHQPKWHDILRQGTTNFDAALTEPIFVTSNNLALTAEQHNQLQRDIRFWTERQAIEDRHQAKELVEAIARTVKQRYAISPQAVILEYASGAAAALDEYSSFLTDSQMDEIFAQIEGNFVGLGVELKTEPAGLLVVNIISGGPADLGGIRAGDRIIQVDDKSSSQVSPDQLADLLRGSEGSLVTVILRDAQGVERTLKLTRRRVEVPSVEDVRIIDTTAGVGYFKLTSFQKTTARDVDAALWKLHDQGMRSLVIDLRGNPGGLLKAAVDVADKFVNDGLIVATRGRSPREDFDHKGQVQGTWRVPLVILIDHDSASASEILAGAVRDHKRGTVVGEKSYGKGSVQGIFPLAVSRTGIRLTTAKWYTPSGQAISGMGIAPDIAVQKSAKPVDGQLSRTPGEDAIFNTGLQTARTMTTASK
ncbi:putative CtpA-like serine protease [Anatilimnocola aggregata]|uniref:Putative CtpA-like serine protease n=1 Tax=Anatilimnocola aggregata TaxID=2528021 RepID=A0A517YDV6_9BACT|nr:S41 family peptidase [Anatilimnocola aggregata]QDU28408.1 putative CtpA-like serine protease [Anatilimnocola aggregata]